MKFESEIDGAALIMTPVVRRLDAAVALQFKQQVLAAIEQGVRVLILDFSRVDFIDSSCLGALISILKSLNSGQLLLCGLNSNIRNMFTLTRMDRVFTLCTDRADALHRMQ